MTALWVEITATRGSAPRDAGTAMMVTETETRGTIGGGALEFAAIGRARDMLREGQKSFTETLPLGPNLGQCCGGAVTLRYTDQVCQTDIATVQPQGFSVAPLLPMQLWLWGAGHVGRAVTQTAPPQAFDITWIDTAVIRFPEQVDAHIAKTLAIDMPLLAKRAPREAHHLIFTYSHDIDLALCATLLGRGFASCGLIGSDTKWARFQKRLRSGGLDPALITCPIGDKSLGKAPSQIAQGVVAALMSQQDTRASA